MADAVGAFTLYPMDELFYAPALTQGESVLDPGEAHHCVRVKRHRDGDTIMVFDGLGRVCEVRLTDTAEGRCTFEILSDQRFDRPRPAIHMAVAPTKNSARYDWMVEKLVEIGVARITPLQCSRSERRSIHTARLQRIVVEAAKQSGQVWLPVLDSATEFAQVVEANVGGRYIAHLGERSMPLKVVANRSDDALVLIGPEGDFTPGELDLAKAAGFKQVSLSRYRLRTETAALVACHTINLMRD